jgi:hypothetical protein
MYGTNIKTLLSITLDGEARNCFGIRRPTAGGGRSDTLASLTRSAVRESNKRGSRPVAHEN